MNSLVPETSNMLASLNDIKRRAYENAMKRRIAKQNEAIQNSLARQRYQNYLNRGVVPEDKPLEDPWIDPTMAFAGGFGGALPSAVRAAGKIGANALLRPAVSGLIGAAADYPIGMATEKVGEKYPKAALPFNIAAGMISGNTVERAISDPKSFWEFGKKLSTQELGEILGHHGSHALFPEFKAEKIGTGEGSQAFGWGAYVTDSHDIGKTYAVMKSGNEGYLYDVTIHKGKIPEEYDYMPWYEEISNQHKEKLITELSNHRIKLRTPSLRGEDIYNSLSYSLMDKYNLPANEIGRPGMQAQKKASILLKKAGIDGIMYPSGTLSGKDVGSTNYVVFDPSDITINDVRKIIQE